jgi:hypothetical protein
MLGRSRFSARINEDSVSIHYDGKEVLYWDIQEWIEDPKLALTIMDVIRKAYEQPHVLYDQLIELGKL